MVSRSRGQIRPDGAPDPTGRTSGATKPWSPLTESLRILDGYCTYERQYCLWKRKTLNELTDNETRQYDLIAQDRSLVDRLE